ncbi:MAG: MlaD family protein [Planctomycetaceae bacterium]
MTERQLQFRVGMFTVAAIIVCAALVFQFGELQHLFDKKYVIHVHFKEAPNLQTGVPIRLYGMKIGTVKKVNLDEKHHGVIADLEIRESFKLHEGTQVHQLKSLLGDVSLEITPGRENGILPAGSHLRGEQPSDPTEVVERMEERMAELMESFSQTSQEWQKVGNNLNTFMDSNQSDLQDVVKSAETSLKEFTVTMRNMNRILESTESIVGDPAQQENIRRTLTALPKMIEDTRATIAASQKAVDMMSRNLENLNRVTAPMAKHSESVMAKLDGGMGHMESLLAELDQFSKKLSQEDGSLNKLVSDPELYQNLNRSASSLSVLMKNLEPMIRDLRIFSDKVARHPELIGVGGALSGSSGLKELPPSENDAKAMNRGKIRQISKE